ncbi:hypothetical protein ACFL6Y_09895 [Elusimicrobiota bacterium]
MTEKDGFGKVLCVFSVFSGIGHGMKVCGYQRKYKGGMMKQTLTLMIIASVLCQPVFALDKYDIEGLQVLTTRQFDANNVKKGNSGVADSSVNADFGDVAGKQDERKNNYAIPQDPPSYINVPKKKAKKDEPSKAATILKGTATGTAIFMAAGLALGLISPKFTWGGVIIMGFCGAVMGTAWGADKANDKD